MVERTRDFANPATRASLKVHYQALFHDPFPEDPSLGRDYLSLSFKKQGSVEIMRNCGLINKRLSNARGLRACSLIALAFHETLFALYP
jgi:hypothetical protein